MRKRFVAQETNHGGVYAKLIGYFVFITLFVICLGIGWQVLQSQKESTWNTEERLTLVWAARERGDFPVALISYEQGQPLVVLQLPPDVQVPVSYGYGDYEVRALYGLAAQEQRYELLTATMTDVMGTPVYDWVVSDYPDCDYVEESCIKKLLYSWWRNDTTTSSLALWDRIALWWKVREMYGDDLVVINAANGSWARQIETVDKVQLVVFDPAFIDARVAPLLTDTKIRTENVAVSIVNTVGEPGLARQVSRIVSGMGAWVVRTENSTDSVETCLLKTHLLPEDSLTVRRLMRIFNCQLVQQEQHDRYGIELQVGKEQQLWWVGSR